MHKNHEMSDIKLKENTVSIRNQNYSNGNRRERTTHTLE